jgi:hypothetical protein
MTSTPGKKLITLKNILNVIYIGAMLLLLFNPSAKALLIRALMAVGFFQPNITPISKSTGTERLPPFAFVNKEGKI